MKKIVIIVIAVLVALLLGILVFNAADMSKTEVDTQVVDVQQVPVATEAIDGASETAGTENDAAVIEGEAAAQSVESEEAAVEIFELSGAVTEVTEAYLVIEDKTHGQVQVNFGDDSIFEGVEMGEVAVGQFVQIMYDGKMTRSLPPQVYALKVGVYAIAGTVMEVAEGSMTLSREELGDEVIVHLPEGVEAPTVGSSVIAYTTGAMTMSLPAQTTAIGVVTK